MKSFFKITFFVISLLFFSCNSDSNKKQHTVGFSQISLDDGLKKSMVQSMEIEAKFYKDLELVILDAENSVDKQIEDIEQLIKQKVDVLIVCPIAPKPLRATIQKAVEADIPVIVIDREFEGVNYSAFIGADNYEIGQNSGNYLASLKESCKIIEIKGWAGTTPTLLRSQGFKSIVDYASLLDVVGVVQDVYKGKGIKESFRKLIKSEKEFNVVFAHSDELALQAYEVAKEFNLENKIKFIGVGGVNGVNGGLDLVQKEILGSTVLYPTGGKEAIRVAKQILTNDAELQREYLLPSLIIDKQNVSVLRRQLDLIVDQEIDIEKQQNRIAKQIETYASQGNFLKSVLLALVIIGGLLVLTYRAKQKEKRHRAQIQDSNNIIQSQKEEIEKIAEDLRINNEATSNFFTGVSHDFKTPVSLIMSSTESLLEKGDKNPKEYVLIHNNSKRLLRMINELLDFKKVESNKFRLKVFETNIYDFVHSIFLDFQYEAENNKIDFSIDSNTKNSIVFIDRDLFDNILFNLFSNAFKFTPIGGSIKVAIIEDEEVVNIAIKDSGIGIVASEQEKIFKQFFQGSNNKQTSSGIGLYLTKEYAKLHSGDVQVISKEGNGAEFIVSIPKGITHFNSEDIVIDAEMPVNNSIDINAFEFESGAVSHKDSENFETILIIEDNTDLRLFLKNKLSSSYKVYESEGIDAVEKAFEVIPDIIISDVNLPEKNGFEITEILKNDERTSHIPTIILTALSSDEAHVRGLQSGVDMFLTKPFNLSVLNQSIESLLYNRKKLQLFYRKQQPETKFVKSEVKSVNVKSKKSKSLEYDFLEKMNAFIDGNIDDSTFTVEVLADKIGISRVQLYRKVKAVLGVSISDYIQEKRLEKSRYLLLDENLSIADVAYSIGFSSPNYFSTAFKNKYGKTPNKYKKEQKSSV